MDSKEPDFSGLSISDLDVLLRKCEQQRGNFAYMVNHATMPSIFSFHTSLRVSDEELDLVKREHEKYNHRVIQVAAEIERRIRAIWT